MVAKRGRALQGVGMLWRGCSTSLGQRSKVGSGGGTAPHISLENCFSPCHLRQIRGIALANVCLGFNDFGYQCFPEGPYAVDL